MLLSIVPLVSTAQTYDQWIASGAHVPAGTPVEQ
jgi:hypothetical protein